VALRYVVAVLILALAGCGRDGAPQPAGSSPPSPRLFLAGDGELWVVDADAERARRIALPQLSPGDPPHRIVRRGGRLVLWGYDTLVLDGRAADRPPRTLVAGSWFFMPSVHPDRVWVALLDRDSPETVRALRAVREITADGTVTVRDVRPPGGRWPHGAVEDGLLFPSRDGRRVDVWSPQRRTVVRRLPVADAGSIGPAHGNLLADCADRRCGALRLTDVRTGDRRVIDAPGDLAFEPWTASFSPSGDVLAIPVRGRGGRPTPRRLALVDVARGDIRLVPGSEAPPGYTFVAWSAAGDHVFLTGGQWTRDRVIVGYRVGAARAERIDVAVGPFYDAAAL
jgi:hypothetical protein